MNRPISAAKTRKILISFHVAVNHKFLSPLLLLVFRKARQLAKAHIPADRADILVRFKHLRGECLTYPFFYDPTAQTDFVKNFPNLSFVVDFPQTGLRIPPVMKDGRSARCAGKPTTGG
jgi:hypothetical protein